VAGEVERVLLAEPGLVIGNLEPRYFWVGLQVVKVLFPLLGCLG
jgi:hypothetical protein